MKKLYLIGDKIDQDKKECSKVIQDIENSEQNLANKEKKEKIIKIVSTGVTGLVAIGGLIFTAATGGLGAPAAVAGIATAGGNAVCCGINIAELLKLLEQLKIYKETKKKEIEYYDQISKFIIEEIAKKKDEIRQTEIKKYAPINI